MKSIKSIFIVIILSVASISILSLNSCKKSKLSCDGVSCKNGGVCVNGNCSCTTGYEGSDCGNFIRDNFVATYNGNLEYNANSKNNIYAKSMTIAAGTGFNQVVISTVGVEVFTNQYELSFANQASVNGVIDFSNNSITVPEQMDADGNIYSGSGSILSGNKFTFTYYTTNTSNNYTLSVKFTGTK
ncbi:MAG: hypothetical protein RJA07_1396 [Bacteroidota bacterium]|jgi:hypothetical protein